MAVNHGKLFGVYHGAVPTLVNDATNTDFTNTMDTRETTNKDSGVFKEFATTFIQSEISGEFHFDPAAGYGFKDLWADFIAGLPLDAKYSDGQSGSDEYTGQAIITELSRSAPNGDNETFNATFLFTGDVTEATIV